MNTVLPAAIRRLLVCFVLGAAIWTAGGLPASAGADPSRQAEIEKENQAAWDAAIKAAVAGPTSIKLGDQGTLQVPKGAYFIPKSEANRVLRSMGNSDDDNRFGMVAGAYKKKIWFAPITFIDEGYVKDDDAKSWNADDLLQKLHDGTDAQNKDRSARGFPTVQLLGWIEEPRYDAAAHRLVWSTDTVQEGDGAADHTVNYNTYVLGREGYFSLDFVTSKSLIEEEKPIAAMILAGISFGQGKRYEDFDASTDKIAAYGLAALVGGVVLKKAGLLALGAAVVVKFAKLILIAVLGAFAAVRRFFQRKPKPVPEARVDPS